MPDQEIDFTWFGKSGIIINNIFCTAGLKYLVPMAMGVYYGR